MVALVDYGMVGNLHSAKHALETVGADVHVVTQPEELKAAERIVLPGVGAFAECVQNLEQSGLLEALREEVFDRGKPFLGICVGLQILADDGEEGGVHRGLGWAAGNVRRLMPPVGFKVPHVGWNEIIPQRDSALLQGLRPGANFYFVHSYHFVPADPTLLAATCEYGQTVTAAIERDNIFATQFHPEKSQQNGLRLLENFLAWAP